jgi:hypothetical protein
MRAHLAFLRTFKDVLRLKLNAAEDLLVNGRREPTDRGVCRHLLAKVDRTLIEQALAREPLRSDPEGRTRMLAGAVRLTADVGVLLAYLESLTHVRTRAEAAQAFGEVVARIDFESLSPARLARLLQVLLAAFAGHERVQVLLGLLARPAVRRAFAAAAAAFAPEAAAALAPLHAVHAHLLGHAVDPAELARGLEQVLAAPDPVLRGYDEPLREGLLRAALGPDVPPPLADRAARVLLPSLRSAGRTHTRLALRRAAQLLRQHADDRARALLEDLARAAPGTSGAPRWLRALSGRRMGRIALAGSPAPDARLMEGFWLDGQRAVWVRTAAASEMGRLDTEARLQRELALPGVAVVLEHGVAHGLPYVAVQAPGRPLAPDPSGTDAGAALALVSAAARVLRALALAGVLVPDAAPARFLGAPGPLLTLADLDGARHAPPGEVATAHASHALALLRALVPDTSLSRLAPEARETLHDATVGNVDLARLIAACDHAALSAHGG